MAKRKLVRGSVSGFLDTAPLCERTEWDRDMKISGFVDLDTVDALKYVKIWNFFFNFELESKLYLHFDVKCDGECEGDGPES